MSISTLEERVAVLEAQVASLLSGSDSAKTRPAWQEALEHCSDSDVLRAINQAALAYREQDRRKFFEQHDQAGGNAE